jgi:hypothetical protein
MISATGGDCKSIRMSLADAHSMFGVRIRSALLKYRCNANRWRNDIQIKKNSYFSAVPHWGDGTVHRTDDQSIRENL